MSLYAPDLVGILITVMASTQVDALLALPGPEWRKAPQDWSVEKPGVIGETDFPKVPMSQG